MDQNLISRYFRENAQSCLSEMYDRNDHSYPTGLNRLRIALQLLRSARPDAGTLVDLGCGGGDLCLACSEVGWTSLGIDQSPEMIEVATNRAVALPEPHRNRVAFKVASFQEGASAIASGSLDAVTALGFIGYLPDDTSFFSEVQRILKPGGHAVISFRNRLLNMMTGSRYTEREVRNGDAAALLDETASLYASLPPDSVANFLDRLAEAAKRAAILVRAHGEPRADRESGGDPSFTFDIEARQHTPRQFSELGAQHGLHLERLVGVHPHLLPLQVNRLLPPGVYNELSSALCAFEEHSTSLVWSSVCIAHFQKPA